MDNTTEETIPERNPQRCIPSQLIELQDPNGFFYKYVMTTVPALGLLFHLLFWSCLAFRYVPTLALYRRLLVVASIMDSLKLTTYILEALWFVIVKRHFFFVKSSAMGTLLQILFAIRAFAIFKLVLVIVWICINCNHDMKVYSSGVTGSLMRKLKDRRCIKILAIITGIAVCLTILTRIPQQMTKTPRCIFLSDGSIEERFFLTPKDSSIRIIANVIQDCITPMLFVIFLCIEFTFIWIKMRKKLTRHSCSYDNLPQSSVERQTPRSQIGVVEESQNEIRITIIFILTPLCISYFLCWSPIAIINILNNFSVIEKLQGWAVTNEIVVWVIYVVELLPSAINPLIFVIATVRFQATSTAAPNHQRASQETRETNV